jgi:hypothetical protein
VLTGIAVPVGYMNLVLALAEALVVSSCACAVIGYCQAWNEAKAQHKQVELGRATQID